MLKSAMIEDVATHGDSPTPQKSLKKDIVTPSDGYSIHGNIKILHSVDFHSDALCCRFSKDGTKVAVGLSDGDVKICKTSTGETIYHLPAPLQSDNEPKDQIKNYKEVSYAVTSLHFVSPEISSRGEILIVTYCGGMVKIWHVGTYSVLSTIKENRQTLTSDLSRTCNKLITAGTSDEIYEYDLETNKCIRTFAPRLNKDVMDGHRFRVLSVKFHPKIQTSFLSGGWDDTVQVWDTRQSRSVRHFFGPHICGGDAIDIDPTYDHILTSSWRRNDVLEVWDYKSGHKIQTFRSDYHGTSMLYCGQWLGNQHVVCGGSDQNMIKITNKSTMETTGMISEMGTGVYSVDFDRANIHPQNDVTTIAAASGPYMHIISNMQQPLPTS